MEGHVQVGVGQRFDRCERMDWTPAHVEACKENRRAVLSLDSTDKKEWLTQFFPFSDFIDDFVNAITEEGYIIEKRLPRFKGKELDATTMDWNE